MENTNTTVQYQGEVLTLEDFKYTLMTELLIMSSRIKEALNMCELLKDDLHSIPTVGETTDTEPDDIPS